MSRHGRLPSKTQERDGANQGAQIGGFWHVGVKSGLQSPQSVLTGGAAGERHRRRPAALIGGQAPDSSYQPVPILVGHAETAHENIGPFLSEDGQTRHRRIDGRHARTGLLERARDDLPHEENALDHEYTHTIETGRRGQGIHARYSSRYANTIAGGSDRPYARPVGLRRIITGINSYGIG